MDPRRRRVAKVVARLLGARGELLDACLVGLRSDATGIDSLLGM